jgi:hypothetical protein
MCEIRDHINELEREAMNARKAIGRSRKRQAKLQKLLDAERARENRTRQQHLDRPNALIRDLMLVLREIDGGDSAP